MALSGFSISRVDSGGVSTGFSSSSGAWPSPRDHTDQLKETHTWHSALYCHYAKKKNQKKKNQASWRFFTPTFHVWSEPFYSYQRRVTQTNRQTDGQIFSLSVVTLHSAAELRHFATWKAWKQTTWNTEKASYSLKKPHLRDIFCKIWRITFSWCSSLLCNGGLNEHELHCCHVQ